MRRLRGVKDVESFIVNLFVGPSDIHPVSEPSIKHTQQCDSPPVIHPHFLFHAQLGSHVLSVAVISGVQSKHLWDETQVTSFVFGNVLHV